ncbi:MAG: hypothetical protein M3422_20980, partial [Actinomycetota bacterium]|nr:hypothetical protein [Actinomycetota bacterium]
MRGALLAVVAALACTEAAPATFTIDDASPALAEDRTVSLDLTNLTAGDLRLTVTSDSCRPTANPETLGGQRD